MEFNHMTLFVAVLGFSIALLLYRSVGRFKHSKPFSGSEDISEKYGCVLLVVKSCRKIICTALDCIDGNNEIEACRNHRAGADMLDTVSRKINSAANENVWSEDCNAVYLNYMIEATDKIAESSRHIVTSQAGGISMSDKCEIQTLRDHIVSMLDNTNVATRDVNHVMEQSIENKDFISHLIAAHSKSMSRDEFEDNSPSYRYLTLLYYLHSFVNSFCRVLASLSNSCADRHKADTVVCSSSL